MRQIIFKNTHIQVVEAMHDLLFLRIFKISAVRQHAESMFFEVARFQKVIAVNAFYIDLHTTFTTFQVFSWLEN